jgi:hypothetical protein
MTIVTAAERILIGLGSTAPAEIDLEVIAWSRGALVEYRPLDGCDARIIGSTRKAVIAVNSRNSSKRRRFSIGHELGHWHHHRGRVLLCGRDDVENPRNDALNPERHADEFASDLILPNYLLHPRHKKIKQVTLAVAREIGDEFTASLTATLLKIVRSNRFAVVVACYNKNKRRWFKRAQIVPGWWYPNEQLDHATFAGDMLFNGTESRPGHTKLELMLGSISEIVIASKYRNNLSC